MTYLIPAVITLLSLYISPIIYTLLKNVINARATGLPIVFVPVNQSSLIWLVFSPTIRHYMRRFLPAQLWQNFALSLFGWEFHEKLRPFNRIAASHGNPESRSYLFVGLGHLELWTADPQATHDMLFRVREFKVPEGLEYALAQYGPNVLTANGNQWARHRKIVTSVIDERISKAVFEESIRQTHGLLKETFSSRGDKTDSVDTSLLFDMLKKTTIHVLIGTGMGNQIPWEGDEPQTLEPGYKMTYIKSVKTVVDNIIGPVLVPTRILTCWPSWLPGYHSMRTVGQAKIEVQKHSKAMLDDERSRRVAGEAMDPTTTNIMSKLLQASEEGSASGQSLTEDEMISNLFIFTAAGFETTASTIAYGIVLLARYPEWQDWILEEVDSLMPKNVQEDVDYRTVYPRATRIMAFMLETVRLYSPVPHVHREVTSPQTLQTATGPTVLPAGTRIYVDSVALHLLPSWRGINHQSDPPFFVSDPNVSDEYTFRPSRWLNPSSSSVAIFRPPKGTFMPWAAGPRVCPGQKMAQVEFTTVLLTLLRNHRIGATPLDGEGPQDIEQRLDARLQDSRWVTVLQIDGIFNPKKDKGLCMRISERR